MDYKRFITRDGKRNHFHGGQWEDEKISDIINLPSALEAATQMHRSTRRYIIAKAPLSQTKTVCADSRED